MREREKSWRFFRSVLLGTVALTLGVFWIGEQYGVSREDILDFLATGALFVGAVVAAALLFAGLVIGVRTIFKR